MAVVISSGHGKYVRGASDIIDEVDEARRVVNEVGELLKTIGVECHTYHDDVSKTQSENLKRIVDFHNSKKRTLDVSVHFNAYEHVEKPMGTECLYLTQGDLADQMSMEISAAGDFVNRGPKKRTDLYFLNNTAAPAILIEVCFVDSVADTEAYEVNFDSICAAIAEVISGESIVPPVEKTFVAHGKCSWFGGPEDTGVSASEGLAFISDVNEAPHLFLPYQPEGTTGLARRLNPYVHFVACRWDYDVTPKEMLREGIAWVTSKRTGYGMAAFPADWGPHESTGRVADLSQGLLADLDLTTDDEVEVIFPAEVKT